MAELSKLKVRQGLLLSLLWGQTEKSVWMRISSSKQDSTFGQTLLKLRTTIGLTQAELSNHLGVSRRAVGGWEAGSSYPKAEHLKEFIALAVQQQAFPAGHEVEEIRFLWKAAHQKELLDECWLSTLLDQWSSPHEDVVLARVEGTVSRVPVMAHPVPGLRVDWGNALAIPFFYGRKEEQDKLFQWVVQERCRIVSVLGMGGIGKSALVVSIMYQLLEHFELVIFRSLRDAPALEDLLDNCLQVLAPQLLSILPANLEQRICLLFSCLCTTRVLRDMDNLE